MTSILLSLLFLVPTWQQGHVLALTPGLEFANGVPLQVALKLRAEDKTTEITAVYARRWRWSPAPAITENAPIQYQISGHDLIVLDNDKKEIKFRILKTRKLELESLAF